MTSSSAHYSIIAYRKRTTISMNRQFQMIHIAYRQSNRQRDIRFELFDVLFYWKQ